MLEFLRLANITITIMPILLVLYGIFIYKSNKIKSDSKIIIVIFSTLLLLFLFIPLYFK
jgi:hypothetical protein